MADPQTPVTSAAVEEASGADERPVLPHDAEPVDEVEGYHYTRLDVRTTVYGPDNTPVGSAEYPASGLVGGVRIPSRWGNFALLAARQHRAANLPDEEHDRVQVRIVPDSGARAGYVVEVHGTDRDDTRDERAVKDVGHFLWSGRKEARVSGRAWTERKVEENFARVLTEFARQGRHVVVRDEGRQGPATSTPAASRTPVSAPTPLTPAAPEPGAMTDEELLQTLDGHNRSGVEALRAERQARVRRRIDGASEVAVLADEELEAEYTWLVGRFASRAFGLDEGDRAVTARRDAVRVEQRVRQARALLAGPVPGEMDDQALGEALERARRLTLPLSHELRGAVDRYEDGLRDETVARRVSHYRQRPDVGGMTLEELTTESSELAGLKEDFWLQRRTEVTQVRDQRIQGVDAEIERREAARFPNELARVEVTRRGTDREVTIDGMPRPYGTVEVAYDGQMWIRAGYGTKREGPFESHPAAVAALVHRYDQDPATAPQRTWGVPRRVMIPVGAHEEVWDWLTHRTDGQSGPPELRRLAAILVDVPVRQKQPNPLTGQTMQVYVYSLEEGLLDELSRVGDRVTTLLRERAADQESTRADREAAKRRIPSMGAALHAINEVRGQAAAAGRDTDRRAVDDNQVAAQVARLAAGIAAGTDEGDSSDDQQVHADGQTALAGVPAPGAGGYAGSGGVPADHGTAAAPSGDRGAGGAGGGVGPRDGLPGQGGPAQPDPGDGGAAGRGAVASSPRGRGRTDPGDSVGREGPGRPESPDSVARFRPDPGGTVRGALARAEANLAAIQVLLRLERDGSATTDADKRVLSSWSGWGSVPVVFLEQPDAKNPVYAPDGERTGRYDVELARWERYSPVRAQLRDLLDPFEWNAAARATLSAHYTPWALAGAMWDGLQAFGFDGGEVLEAGCGSGIFFGAAPDLEDLRLTGVELDGVTARICQRIYPHANVLAESFADTDAPAAGFDAAIGNVPFAQTPFTERRYGATGHSLHNGFLIKQLALVREGGLVLAVTSRWTLDGEDASARRRMAHYGDLLAAYRLPAGVFAETTGVDVVVDVLVLRRRGEGEPGSDPVWLDAPKQELNGSTHTINAYFGEHPQHVLGQLTTETGPYGPRPTVKGDPAAALEELQTRLRRLAAQAIAAGQGYRPHPDGVDRPALNLRTARDKHANDYTGRLYRDEDGRIWQHINGADPAPAVCSDGNTTQMLALMRMRDVAAELRDLDRTGDEPVRAESLRAQLRDLHASYTAAHGPLSRPRQSRMAAGEPARDRARAEGRAVRDTERTPTAWGWFREDPDAATVLALESWDRVGQTPVLSEVLTRRPGTLGGGLQHTEDPKTALTAVMGATGRVDLDRVAALLGTDPEEARRRLGTDVFDNPDTGRLEHAGSYLSGAVRLKLEQARQAAATDPVYAVNVAALELVQPPEKRIGQFTPQLGAHWIPAAVVQGFLREYLGDPTLHVNHNDRYGWTVDAGKVPDAVNALKGTERRSALQIARAVLGRGSLIVEDTTATDGRVVHEVNEDASRAARQKADAMRSAFEEYVTADSGRVKSLTEAYNRIMNGHVVRNYDGLSPAMAGFTTERTPHAWQTAGAARMQFERSVILAHEVGLGKTTTMIMGAAALKASGQINKPFVVMQRHLARSWLKEAQFLYPTADIRLIPSEMLSGDERRRTLEWLRSNTPDLTLFTEGAFTSVKMSPEYQEWYEFRELENLREQILRERGVPDNALAAMRLEQRLATMEAQLHRNAAPMRTPGALYWEDLGFDYGMIDEAHRFLGVGFRSRDAGGDTPKIRAVDLHQKLTEMHRLSAERGGVPTATLASGTPLKNSIFDQYKVLALAAPWVLEEFGVAGPDLWAQTFGQTAQRVEMAPDGSGLKVVERFSRFVSKRAMKTMWGLVADTKTADDVGIARPRVAGGGPQLHLVDPTPDQRNRLARLVARGAAIHAGEVTRDQDNMLAVANDGRAIACDPRLVDPSAPPGPKLETVADWFAARYHATKDRGYAVSHIDSTPHPTPGGLLIGFLNQGTPGGNNKGGFDAYAALRDLCAARGIPAEKIAFAQDHNRNLESLEELYRRCSDGEVSLVLASTEVMGTGANIQNRAVALVHIDLDWTPASIDQRNGRIVRFGNQNPEVEIAIFGLRGSMDSWQAGLLASKAEGLRDIQRPESGDDIGDTVEEIGDVDWDYATMQAEIGGNPHMGQLIHARTRLSGLESDRRNHAADRLRQSELLAAKKQEAELTRQAITRREEVLPLITPVRGDAFTITIGETTHSVRRQAAPPLREAVANLLIQHRSAGRSPWNILGQFGGLPFGVRTELTETGQLQALVGFPDLRHSEAAYSVGDLTKETSGTAMLRHLTTALEQAGDHQLLDRQRLPGLETEITQLAQQQAAVDYTVRIDYARRRVELLDDLVAAIAERDKISELREEDLDPATYPTPRARSQELARRAAQRRPLQDKVDQAVERLRAFDQDHPQPSATQSEPRAFTTPRPAPDNPQAVTDGPTTSQVDPDGQADAGSQSVTDDHRSAEIDTLSASDTSTPSDTAASSLRSPEERQDDRRPQPAAAPSAAASAAPPSSEADVDGPSCDDPASSSTISPDVDGFGAENLEEARRERDEEDDRAERFQEAAAVNTPAASGPATDDTAAQKVPDSGEPSTIAEQERPGVQAPADVPATGLAVFTPAEQVMIAHVVQDWAANYYDGPLRLGRDSSVRYVSEGHLRGLAAAHGYLAVHDGVDEYLAAHPGLLDRRITQAEREARREARIGRSDALLDQVPAAGRAGEYARALELVDQAELAAPENRDYDAIRDRIRALATRTAPPQDLEPSPDRTVATPLPTPADQDLEPSPSPTSDSEPIAGPSAEVRPPTPREGAPVTTPPTQASPASTTGDQEIVIEHTREGSLVFGTVRGDDPVREALRATRTWRWSSNIGTDGAWYLPRRRGFEDRSQQVLDLEDRLRALGRPLVRRDSDTWRSDPSQTTTAVEPAAASPGPEDASGQMPPTADSTDADNATVWQQDRDLAEGRTHGQAGAQTTRKLRAGEPLTEAEQEDADAMFSPPDDNGTDPTAAVAEDAPRVAETSAPIPEQLGFDLSPPTELPEAGHSPAHEPDPGQAAGTTEHQVAPDTQEIVLPVEDQAQDVAETPSTETVTALPQPGPVEASVDTVPGGADGCWARPWTGEEIQAARERMAAETPAPSQAPMTPEQIAEAWERMAAETPAPSQAPMTPNELHEQLLLRMGLAADDVQRLRAGLVSARDDIDRVLYSRPYVPGRTSSTVRAYEAGMDYLGAACQAVAAGVREAVAIGIQEIAGPEWERISRVWQQMRQTWIIAREGAHRGGPSALQPWGTQLRTTTAQAARAIADLAGQWAARWHSTGHNGSWAHRAAQTLAAVATHVADHLQPATPVASPTSRQGLRPVSNIDQPTSPDPDRLAAAIRLAATPTGPRQPRAAAVAPATASEPSEPWDAAITRMSALQARMNADFRNLDQRLTAAAVTPGWAPASALPEPVMTSTALGQGISRGPSR